MAKKATAEAATPQVLHVDARTGIGMFFTLTGTILAAFGVATRDNAAAYVKSQGIDANLWWGLALLVFGIVMLALGRRGQTKTVKAQLRPPAKQSSQDRR
jgi:hypothetical protein